MTNADEKTARNKRVQAQWDDLSREGKHGHYETLFRVVREEVERERAALLTKLETVLTGCSVGTADREHYLARMKD